MLRDRRGGPGRSLVTESTGRRFPRADRPRRTAGLRAFRRQKRLAVKPEIIFRKLAELVDNPEILVQALCHNDWEMRFNALLAVSSMAEKGMDISPMTPQLVAGLSDSEAIFRSYCAWALAKSESVDLSEAVPTLAAVLSEDKNQMVRGAASLALYNAGKNGADIMPAREALMAASIDKEDTVRCFANAALFYLRR